MKWGEWVVTSSCARAVACLHSSATFGQFGQQPRVQEVFRLLDADELRRRRAVQHHQVSEHFQGAAGGETRQDRLVERGVLDLEQKASIRHCVGDHFLKLGHATPQNFEDLP